MSTGMSLGRTGMQNTGMSLGTPVPLVIPQTVLALRGSHGVGIEGAMVPL